MGSNRELEQLLPFYVNGTLEGEELRQVEAWVESSQAAREEVAFLSRLREQVKASAGAAPQSDLRLRQAIGQMRREKRGQFRTPNWARVAIAAGLAVIVAQSALLLRPDDRAGYTLAGTPEIRIEFATDATAGEIQTLLDSIDAEIVAGPGALGVFQLDLPEDADAAAVDAALEALRASGDVVLRVERIQP